MRNKKAVGGFKQDVIDLNEDYETVQSQLNRFVRVKLGIRPADTDIVDIEYGALWSSSAKSQSSKPLSSTAYGDFNCEGDYSGLQVRIRNSLGGKKKDKVGNNVLQLLATVSATEATPPTSTTTVPNSESDELINGVRKVSRSLIFIAHFSVRQIHNLLACGN